jgi:hypothetical protein
MRKDVLKFEEFIKEAKEAQDKVESKKDKSVELLTKLLKSKTKIEMSDKWPTEQGIYSLSGVKRYFKDNGLTNNDADQAVNKLQGDKKSGIKSVKVKNFHYGETYPYFYISLSDSEATEAKKKMEDWSKEQAKPEIEKKKELSKKEEAVKKLKAEESKAKRARKTTTPKTGEKPKTNKPRTKRK